jgi:hypothetical protein
MFCLRYHPNCRRAASLMRSEVQGGSQTSSTLIALVSGEGTFQSFVTLPLRSPDRDFGDGQLHRVAHSTRV